MRPTARRLSSSVPEVSARRTLSASSPRLLTARHCQHHTASSPSRKTGWTSPHSHRARADRDSVPRGRAVARRAPASSSLEKVFRRKPSIFSMHRPISTTGWGIQAGSPSSRSRQKPPNAAQRISISIMYLANHFLSLQHKPAATGGVPVKIVPVGPGVPVQNCHLDAAVSHDD